MAKVSNNRKKFRDGDRVELPVLPLRGVVVFPGETTSLFVAREKSLRVIDKVLDEGLDWKVPKWVFLAAQENPKEDDPHTEELLDRGTVARVVRALRVSDGTLKIQVEGMYRAQVSRFTQADPFIQAEVTVHYPTVSREAVSFAAAVRKVLQEYVRVERRVPPEILTEFDECRDYSTGADLIARSAPWSFEQKFDLLEMFDVYRRLVMVIDFMNLGLREGRQEIHNDGLTEEELYYTLGGMRAIVSRLDNGETKAAREALVCLMGEISKRCPIHWKISIEELKKKDTP